MSHPRSRSPRWSAPRRVPRTQPGFTLIELMIVISIVALVIAAGVPSIFRSFQKDALGKAVNDIVEGCSHARAQAILQGIPSEFVIRAHDGQMSVTKVALPAQTAEGGSPFPEADDAGAGGSKVFSAKLHEDIAVELIDVNFHDQMKAAESHVRFFPNGTSDEFTVVISSTSGSWKISLDLVTALANAERLR